MDMRSVQSTTRDAGVQGREENKLTSIVVDDSEPKENTKEQTKSIYVN